jgi:hypothetical protein
VYEIVLVYSYLIRQKALARMKVEFPNLVTSISQLMLKNHNDFGDVRRKKIGNVFTKRSNFAYLLS